MNWAHVVWNTSVDAVTLWNLHECWLKLITRVCKCADTESCFALVLCRITFQCLDFLIILFLMTRFMQNQRKKSVSPQSVYLVSKLDTICDSFTRSRSLSYPGSFFCSVTDDEREWGDETSENAVDSAHNLVNHGCFFFPWEKPRQHRQCFSRVVRGRPKNIKLSGFFKILAQSAWYM